MSNLPTDANALPSTRPYLLRALYEWCTDNGFTPYVAVLVDATVQVPREFVKNNEIVLNISYDATSSLKLGNEFIEFKARFAGAAREIMVPIDRVIAIYARENGQGMAFPMPHTASAGPDEPTPIDSSHAPLPALASIPGGLTESALHEPHDAQIISLKTGDALPSDFGDDAPEPPPKSPGSAQGARPSLKRVK
jgi:stringent starvation protein B